MKPENIWILNVYPLVKMELAQIPEQLWDIFWCNTAQEWFHYDVNIRAWKSKQMLRRQTWALVKKFNLPIKYRRYPFRDVMCKVRIMAMIAERNNYDESGI